jgi:hypothetical protein
MDLESYGKSWSGLPSSSGATKECMSIDFPPMYYHQWPSCPLHTNNWAYLSNASIIHNRIVFYLIQTHIEVTWDQISHLPDVLLMNSNGKQN